MSLLVITDDGVHFELFTHLLRNGCALCPCFLCYVSERDLLTVNQKESNQ